MHQDYKRWRQRIESHFQESRRDPQSQDVVLSPSGNFQLTIDSYSTGEHSWAYTRGRVRSTGNSEIIADIKRNYSHFWFAWVHHRNGFEYLLCGEDYQGQSIVNLNKGETYNHFPESGYNGGGFCWAAAHASPNSTVLAVEGCYWGGINEIVFFDFTDPEDLPYRELLRVGDTMSCESWLDDGSFKLSREIQVRKTDSMPYEDLSDAEQDELDDNEDLGEYVKQEVTISRDELTRQREQ